MIDNKGTFTVIKDTPLDYMVVYYNPDGVTPIDLTDYKAITRVKENINDETALIELTTENGGMELGGIDGTIRWIMTKSATAAIDIHEGIYDVFLINTADNNKEDPLIFNKKFYSPERV